MAPPQARKRSQGRKKIEMKLIPDESARIVTFSKRRAGIFKKATELSVLCGAQIALIIFSPGGRAYSFGNPDVESVMDRFFNRKPMPNLQDSEHGMRIHAALLQHLKEQCDQKSKELEIRKRRGKEIEAALESSACLLSEERLSQLDLHQLKQLKQMMEKLSENVHCLANSMQSESVEPPRPRDVTGSSDLEKAVRATIKNDERNASSIPPVWLRLKKVDLATMGRDGRIVSSAPSAPLRSKKVDLATVGRDERDASPIPPDWLSL